MIRVRLLRCSHAASLRRAPARLIPRVFETPCIPTLLISLLTVPSLFGALLLAVLLGLAPGARAAEGLWGPAPPRAGGGGEERIDEASPDDTGTGPGGRAGSGDLATDLRDFVAGSLARYDEVKSGAAGFRRQGWFPSFFLRDPAADVVLEPGPGAGKAVTVHVSHARRDVEQRLVVAPVDRFVLPGADRRFFAELLAALAVASPEISRARIRFWFGVLQPDGRMGWELQGSLALTAAAARRAPPGKRNQETVWPLLEENSVPASLWP